MVALVFAASLVACFAAYVAVATPGRWFSSAPDMSYGAKALTLARGAGTLGGNGLVLTRAAEDGNTIVSTATDFAATDLAQVTWIVSGIAPNVSAALLWYTDVEPSRVNRRPLTADAGQLAPLDLRHDAHWIGRIKGLALALHGPLDAPVSVRGVVARPGDAFETLGDRFREWTTFRPWSGTSINTVPGGADAQALPLPLLLAAVIAVSAAVLYAIARHRFAASATATVSATATKAATAMATATAAAVIAGTLAGWLVLDARWTVSLLRQDHDSAQQFAGKNWRERHLAATDGALFAFIDKARRILPAGPARVFVVADADYLRARAAYHLYPYNVWYVPLANLLPPVNRLHEGDWIVVYQRRGVEYDAALHRLRWEGGATIPAELRLLDHGGALFEVH